MFHYYTIENNVYYCAGHNPITNEFELYNFDPTQGWIKNKLTFTSQDDNSHDYDVKSSNKDDTITLRVFGDTNDMLLQHRQGRQSANLLTQFEEHHFTLKLISEQQLPLDSRRQLPGTKQNEVEPSESREKPSHSKSNRGINMQILGAFIAGLGIIAVAVAFAALSGGATIGLAIVGCVAITAGVGFFAAGRGRHSLTTPEASPLISSSW